MDQTTLKLGSTNDWHQETSGFGTDLEYKTCLGFVTIFSGAPRPLGAAYVPILVIEVEREERTSENGDREAIATTQFCVKVSHCCENIQKLEIFYPESLILKTEKTSKDGNNV